MAEPTLELVSPVLDRMTFVRRVSNEIILRTARRRRSSHFCLSPCLAVACSRSDTPTSREEHPTRVTRDTKLASVPDRNHERCSLSVRGVCAKPSESSGGGGLYYLFYTTSVFSVAARSLGTFGVHSVSLSSRITLLFYHR